MLYDFLDKNLNAISMFTGVAVSFLLTYFCLLKLMDKLPHDQGRAFAVNGAKSAGKPRGAGIIFIICFVICMVLFVPIKVEYLIYAGLTVVAMMTGFLDDASEKPWGELKKGILDFCISVLLTATYIYYNSCDIYIPFTHKLITISPVLFAILCFILVWASINVTNCSDGVDGLCGCLSIVTLISAYFLCKEYCADREFAPMVILMVSVLLAYLWFNASPSRLLMGDAGSRAIGFFIAVACLKSSNPILYIPIALVLILDGGLGLIKLTILRVFKVKGFMKNLRTPIHDHMRKNRSWSDTQVVIRFMIIQTIISLCVIYLCRI